MKGKAFSGENAALGEGEAEQRKETMSRRQMIVTSAAAIAGATLLGTRGNPWRGQVAN
jgi:hypothetical protein